MILKFVSGGGAGKTYSTVQSPGDGTLFNTCFIEDTGTGFRPFTAALLHSLQNVKGIFCGKKSVANQPGLCQNKSHSEKRTVNLDMTGCFAKLYGETYLP